MVNLVKNYPNKVLLGVVVFLMALLWILPSSTNSLLLASTFPNKDAKAEVSITYDQQMDFGQLADNDGSVILGLGDSITSDPDHIVYGGSPYSGIFTITGDPDTAVDISIEPNINNSGFTLSTFTSSEGNIPLVGVLLSSAGELILTVGATLTIDEVKAAIGAGQTINFRITSTYN